MFDDRYEVDFDTYRDFLHTLIPGKFKQNVSDDGKVRTSVITSNATSKDICGYVGDRVSFEFKFRDENVETFDGTIEVVDKFGAWEIDNPREPSYDVLVCNWRGSGEMMLVKHVRESKITKYENRKSE